MDLNLIAEHIKLLRAGPVCHSYRKLSEVICDIYPEFFLVKGHETLRGNQMHGEELCYWAKDQLGISDQEYATWNS